MLSNYVRSAVRVENIVNKFHVDGVIIDVDHNCFVLSLPVDFNLNRSVQEDDYIRTKKMNRKQIIIIPSSGIDCMHRYLIYIKIGRDYKLFKDEL